jgi:hypothetical protein
MPVLFAHYGQLFITCQIVFNYSRRFQIKVSCLNLEVLRNSAVKICSTPVTLSLISSTYIQGIYNVNMPIHHTTRHVIVSLSTPDYVTQTQNIESNLIIANMKYTHKTCSHNSDMQILADPT